MQGTEADYKNQWGLEAIRANRAWAQLELKHGIGLAPGGGQTVGLLDSGIDQDHPVFAGKTITETFLMSAEDETGDRLSHGTAVASVIVGRPLDSAFIEDAGAARGVAWGADVAMFALPVGDGSGGGTYVPISPTGLGDIDADWAAGHNGIIGWSGGALDFVNVSVGYQGIIDQYSEAVLRDNFGDTIAALAQEGASDKTVFVWAAGNSHGAPCDPADFTANPDLCESYVDNNGDTNYRVNAKSVEMDSGLPARIAELRGHLISVVAVTPGSDYQIASFSNRCGIAMNWCIAAPGVRIRSAYFGPGPDNLTGVRAAFSPDGTSFAAPMVTGALVVMKDYFRDELYNTDLVSRLLATADKGGIFADADVYGRGLLDLAAATSPVGATNIALDGRVGGEAVDLTMTRLGLGHALGDGLTQALAGQEVAAFDDLGAPFWYSLASLTGAAAGFSSGARLRDFMAQPREANGSSPWHLTLGAFERANGAGPAPLRLGFLDTPTLRASGGHLSLAGRALTLGTAEQGGVAAAAFSTEGLDGVAPASGATLAWRPEGAPLGLRGGWVGEREAFLGTRARGAFGRMAAVSTFAGIEASEQVGAWHLGAMAEIGTVGAAMEGGLIAQVSPLTTSAFALHAARSFADAGTLTFTLSQPLRVEAGHARLSVPVGRTKDGLVRRRSVTADLVPTGRQIEVAAQWRQPLDKGGELRLGAAWTRHPGHAAATAPDLTLLAGWRRAF